MPAKGLASKMALHWLIPDPVAKGSDVAFNLTHSELNRLVTALAPHLIASQPRLPS